MPGKRPDGDGLVRKRTDGRWEGRIVIGHKDDNSPIYKSVFAKTQKELMPKLRQAIEDYQGADFSEESNITLNEWMKKWLAEYAEPALRQNTVTGYKRNIKNHIAPALGNKQLRFITSRDVQKFYNSLSRKEVNKVGNHKTLADSTVRAIHMLLHEILDSAVKANLIFKNPAEGAKIPKNNYAPKRILNEEQLEIFMKAILDEPMWHDFFYTEITTGLRLGEICGLKWSDLDESTGKLKIQRSVSQAEGGEVNIGETKTERRDKNRERNTDDPSAERHSQHPDRAEEKFRERLDIPEPARSGKADRAEFGIPPSQSYSERRGTSRYPLPRPAPHLRYPRADKRSRRENAVRDPRSHKRELHARHLHSRHHRYAEKRFRCRRRFHR